MTSVSENAVIIRRYFGEICETLVADEEQVAVRVRESCPPNC